MSSVADEDNKDEVYVANILETCNDILERATTGYKIKFCDGYYMKENPKKEEVDEFFEYYEHISKLNEGSWLYDFLCAINNRKICMIDNDFFPENFKELISKYINVKEEEIYKVDDKLYIDIIDEHFKLPRQVEVIDSLFGSYFYLKEDEYEKKLLFLRYIFLTKCDLKMLVMTKHGDPTVIYYKKDKWEDALLLYLYHEERIEEKFIYPHGDELAEYTTSNISEELIRDYVFNMFQSILLGYTMDSLIRYLFLKPSQYNFNISSLSDREKIKLYRDIYKSVYIDHSNEIEIVKKLYARTEKVIEKFKISLRSDPKWKYFAYGLDKDDKVV